MQFTTSYTVRQRVPVKIKLPRGVIRGAGLQESRRAGDRVGAAARQAGNGAGAQQAGSTVWQRPGAGEAHSRTVPGEMGKWQGEARMAAGGRRRPSPSRKAAARA